MDTPPKFEHGTISPNVAVECVTIRVMSDTCDNQGKTLDRALYMWNPFSFPRQIALPQGKTTNTLFYHLPFAALSTNKELTIRLEGHLGSMWRGSGPLTSNIVKLTLK